VVGSSSSSTTTTTTTMPPPQKTYSVLALVSGGKDSVFALQLCQSHGHEITALGNLTPKDQLVEELDSHCFQTVSHSMINLYPRLIDKHIPVFRRKLNGQSVHVDLNYPERGVETDEIEDLRALIQFAKEHARVDAVCSGAILSDYQRLRVERICFELNLVSLSYLWKQMPQKRLLEDILNVGRIEAVLVKTAAMGLDPRKHLGKTLGEVKEDLIRIEEEYGSHSCGEGGEFESLVLDAPFFTRGRLRIEESEVIETSTDRFARSGHLKIMKVNVEKKVEDDDEREIEDVDEKFGEVIWVPDDYIATPPLASLSLRSPDIRDDIAKSNPNVEVYLQRMNSNSNSNSSSNSSDRGNESRTVWLQCNNKATADEAFHELKLALKREGGMFSIEEHATMTHCYLKSMDDFGSFNVAYSRHMRAVEPSARACVALPLQDDISFLLSMVLSRSKRVKSLHVASISAWAPACIGPYAQLCGVDPFLYVAGQIGMQPRNLDLESNIYTEARRCVKSCHQIREEICKNNGSEKVSFAKQAVQTTFYASSNRANECESVHSVSFNEYCRNHLWDPNEPYCDPLVVNEEKEKDGSDENMHEKLHVGEKDMSDVTDLNLYFMQEKLSGLFMSLFLTVPMLPKNAAMEIEPILASSLVFPSHSMDDNSNAEEELYMNSHNKSSENYMVTAKYIGRANEWARALIFFERRGEKEKDEERVDVTKYFERIEETYKLAFSDTASIKIYYSTRGTTSKDAEVACRDSFYQLFEDENSPFSADIKAEKRSPPTVAIPVLDCGYFGRTDDDKNNDSETRCAFALELVAVREA
jgi:diphthine-ammonia ligase